MAGYFCASILSCITEHLLRLLDNSPFHGDDGGGGGGGDDDDDDDDGGGGGGGDDDDDDDDDNESCVSDYISVSVDRGDVGENTDDYDDIDGNDDDGDNDNDDDDDVYDTDGTGKQPRTELKLRTAQTQIARSRFSSENRTGTCSADITTGLAKELCSYAGADWLKFICQSEGVERSNPANTRCAEAFRHDGADTAIWQSTDSNMLVDFEIFVFFKSLRERRSCVAGKMEVGSFIFSPLIALI